MKHVRLLSAFVFLALLLALVPATLAQDSTFGLSAEDFQAMTAAGAATSSATSAQFTFTLGLDGSGDGETFDVDLTGSGLFGTDSAGSPIFQLMIGGQAVADGETQPLNFEVRSVNNTIYVQAPDMMGPQWIMISEEDMGMMTAGMPVDPMALASGDMSGLSEMEGMDELSGVLAGLSELQPEQYIAMTRDGDHFTTTIDVVGMLGSEAFQNAVVTAAQNDASTTETPEEIRATLAQLPAALAGTTLTFEQYIADGMISRAVLSGTLNADPAAMGETGEPVNLNINFDVNLSGYNQAYSVEAPAEAMPLSQMMGGS